MVLSDILWMTACVANRAIEGDSGPDPAVCMATSLPRRADYPSEAMVRRGEMEQGTDLLNKPFRKADLAWKVREVFRKAA